MTARRVFTKRELREAVRLVQESGCGVKMWPDGAMEIMPPRLDTMGNETLPATLGEWRKRRVEATQRHLQRQEKTR